MGVLAEAVAAEMEQARVLFLTVRLAELIYTTLVAAVVQV
jgi:hypothetical protein